MFQENLINGREVASSALASERPAVEVIHRKRGEINPFEATDIDRRHALAGGVAAFAKRMDAALGAEAMLDGALTKA